jgi:hypothetical protein
MRGCRPWVCNRCGHRAVELVRIAYHTEIKQDGVLYTVAIPDLEVLRCWSCRQIVLIEAARDRIRESLDWIRNSLGEIPDASSNSSDTGTHRDSAN